MCLAIIGCFQDIFVLTGQMTHRSCLLIAFFVAKACTLNEMRASSLQMGEEYLIKYGNRDGQGTASIGGIHNP